MNFLPAHMYANHVPGWYPWRSEEDVGSSKSGSRIVWAVVWMLRIGPRSFVKAPSALNNAVISPARHWVMCTHDQRSKTMLHICSGQQLERLRDMWQYYYKKKSKALQRLLNLSLPLRDKSASSQTRNYHTPASNHITWRRIGFQLYLLSCPLTPLWRTQDSAGLSLKTCYKQIRLAIDSLIPCGFMEQLTYGCGTNKVIKL